MFSSVKRKGQENASNVAVVVFLIAVFLTVYILLLPAEDREELLEGGVNESVNGADSGNGGVVLLQQNPGLLRPLETDTGVHKIDPVNLFFKDQPKVSDLAMSIRVGKSLFGDESRKLSFNSESLDDINKATLFFAVDEGEGNLIISLNGVEIFDEEASGLQSVLLPVELLKESNSIEFKASSPGWNFIGSNEYGLKDLKVRQNFEVTNTKEKRGFVLSSAENGDGVLSYSLFCNSAGRLSRLKIVLNNKEVSDEALNCRSASRQVDIDSNDMNEGGNELVFQIDNGDYLLNEIKLEVGSEQGGGISYKFAVAEEDYNSIQEGKKEVELIMEFADRERHRAELRINGDEISVDNEEKKYEQEITKFIEEGTNKLEIMPGNEFELVSLKVRLV